MSHENTTLYDDLKLYLGSYPEEAEEVQRFQKFILGHPDCFERSLLIGHLTGSAWLVNRTASHVLLTHHKKLNLWVQLGGHADGDTDLRSVALREAEEESGISGIRIVSPAIFDVDIHTIPERKGVPEHLHYDVRYLLQTGEGEQFSVSDESHALAWVEIDKIRATTEEESILRMARKSRTFFARA